MTYQKCNLTLDILPEKETLKSLYEKVHILNKILVILFLHFKINKKIKEILKIE